MMDMVSWYKFPDFLQACFIHSKERMCVYMCVYVRESVKVCVCVCVKTLIKIIKYRDFSGSLVVKTLCFQC